MTMICISYRKEFIDFLNRLNNILDFKNSRNGWSSDKEYFNWLNNMIKNSDLTPGEINDVWELSDIVMESKYYPNREE